MKKDKLEIRRMHDGANSKMFRNAAQLREEMTDAEALLWEYLKTKPQGFKFRRQHPIAGYILDFYCHQSRLSIEVDGAYHLHPEQKIKDQERTSYVNEMGITELRFTNTEIETEFENSITRIMAQLSADTL
jgi:very-short-patch-repair endonuclease